MTLIHAYARVVSAALRRRALALEGDDVEAVTAVGRTALLANNARRLEALAPDPLYRDDYAHCFRSDVFAATLVRLSLPCLARAVKAGTEDVEEMPPWVGIGSTTAYIDSRLRDALAEGTQQVVLLGSGLDTRPLRLRDEAVDVRFFEADEAAMLDFKVRRLAASGHSPYPAELVRGNYLEMDLFEELEKVGLQADKPIFFLWEANTMYIPTQRAMMFVAKLLSMYPRCTVLFDYFTEPVASASGPKPTGCAETDWELQLAVEVVGDGKWLLVGPWNSDQARAALGYDVLEELSLPEIVRLVRGEEIGQDLLSRFRTEFEKGISACHHFCLVRPGSGSSHNN